MFVFFQSEKFLLFCIKYQKLIFYFFISLLLIGLWEGLVVSPEDYVQGDSVRIMYVHVPSAWISLMCFSLISFLCIVNFLFKFKNALIIYKNLAPIGLLFCIISIVTGSIWGEPTWGTWWAWDARLTSMLVLTFFYSIFIVSYKYISNQEISSKVCTAVSVLGFLNVFIVKYSVEWWSTLHQPASIKVDGTSSIHSTMLLPLCLMLLTFLLYCGLIFLMKYKSEIIRIKLKGLKRL